MTYRFKISRRLAGNHPWRAIACAAVTLFAGCQPGSGSDPILSQGEGVLTLTAAGLAPQGKLQAIVIGPGGFEREITEGGSLTGLPIGTYHVHFLPTMVDGDRWVPSSEEEMISITSPSQRVSLTISYEFSSGTVDLRPEGVPVGTELMVHLTGAGGYSRDVAGPSTVRGLVPGTYTVTPTQGTFGAAVYRPTTPATQIEVVSSTTPLPAVIPYWRAIGTLDVQVSGLPLGAVAQYTVAGPGNYQATRTGPAQLTSLDPGTYTITVSPVPFEGNTWAPITAPAPVAIDTGTATIAIAHEITTGTLALDVDGLPAGLSAPVVTISGPAGFVHDLTTSQQWVGVVPGTYNARASVVSDGERTFVPNQLDQNIPVAPGTNPSRGSVNYSELVGSLTLTLAGLPSGAAGRVVVTGNAFADTVVSTSTLFGLSAGSYALVAASVTIGGVVYLPTPSSQSAIIASGGSDTKTVTYAAAGPTTGSLDVSVTGLPGGAPGAISVTGPNGYSQTVTITTTLGNLTPGSYTIAAVNTVSNGTVFQPTPASQSAVVTAGGTIAKVVSYTAAPLTTGSLTVSVTGLSGANGAIIVSGPSGFTRTIGATTTLADLAPGTYTISASNVATGSGTAQPTPATQTVTVTAGATVTKSVAYAVPGLTTGALAVTLSGLPGGAAAAIAVTGPNGFSQTVTATTTLNGLVPGSYSVAAASITSGGATYTPTPATQSATVAAGTTVTKAVAYAAPALTTGSLAVTLSGLPGGAAAAIAVTGPNGFSQTVTATTTLNGLVPGTYSVAAANITSGGATYRPTPATQSATVAAGTTVTKAVAYAVSTGALSVTMSGLPGGSAGSVSVTGPGGFTQPVTATTTLNGLSTGTYTISASNVATGSGTFQPTPATQTATVTAGTTVTKAVAYAVSTGALSVTMSGLPGGSAGSVSVTGPGGFTQSVTATTMLNGLLPGTYTMAASTVSASGTSYTPSPSSQTASVTAGATANRTVTYAANSGPATITVDTTTVFQTMTGWEATTQAGQSASGFSGWQNSLMDQAVTDLGVNAIRLEIKSGAEAPVDYYHQLQTGQITNIEFKAVRYRPVNDNSSSNAINASGFQFSEMDESVDLIVLPLRQRMQARGEHLTINLNYVSFAGATFHTTNAAEYAELMLATFQHLQSKYGWVPDAIEVILEPDNGTGWTGTQIGNAIVATGDRLAAAGFHPEFIAPSTMSMAQAVPYTNQIVAVPGALNYLTTIAYHRYAGVSDANLTAIRATAAQYNLRTAQLEHIGSGVEDLYKDLTLANVSAWQQYTLAFPTSDNGAQYFTITGGQAVMASRTKQLRQYFRYVRAGARRVAATSASGSVRPVAFTHPGGGMAVVVHVDSPGTFTVAGLRPGSYAVEMSNSAGALIVMPSVTVSGGNSVSISPSQTGVLTLHKVP